MAYPWLFLKHIIWGLCRFKNFCSHVIMVSIDSITCYAPQHMVLYWFSIRACPTIWRLSSLPLVFQVYTIDCSQSETDGSILMVFVIVYVLLADVTLHTILIYFTTPRWRSASNTVVQLLLCIFYHLISIMVSGNAKETRLLLNHCYFHISCSKITKT